MNSGRLSTTTATNSSLEESVLQVSNGNYGSDRNHPVTSQVPKLVSYFYNPDSNLEEISHWKEDIIEIIAAFMYAIDNNDDLLLYWLFSQEWTSRYVTEIRTLNSPNILTNLITNGTTEMRFLLVACGVACYEGILYEVAYIETYRALQKLKENEPWFYSHLRHDGKTKLEDSVVQNKLREYKKLLCSRSAYKRHNKGADEQEERHKKAMAALEAKHERAMAAKDAEHKRAMAAKDEEHQEAISKLENICLETTSAIKIVLNEQKEAELAVQKEYLNKIKLVELAEQEKRHHKMRQAALAEQEEGHNNMMAVKDAEHKKTKEIVQNLIAQVVEKDQILRRKDHTLKTLGKEAEKLKVDLETAKVDLQKSLEKCASLESDKKTLIDQQWQTGLLIQERDAKITQLTEAIEDLRGLINEERPWKALKYAGKIQSLINIIKVLGNPTQVNEAIAIGDSIPVCTVIGTVPVYSPVGSVPVYSQVGSVPVYSPVGSAPVYFPVV